MSKFVYFVRPKGMDGPIKIGCSDDPVSRLNALMAWAPWPLEVVATVPGDGKLERRIHGLFAEQHSHREWFRASPELHALIEELSCGRPIGELIDLHAPLKRFRTRNGPFFTPERRLYLSYNARLRNAFRKLRGGTHCWAPNDVDSILDRWDGRPRRYRHPAQPGVFPTPEELRRLDDVLSDPQRHAITQSERFPPEDDDFAEAA